uniref:WGS project CAEQ00000000 data, annotated contig 1850 n=1 Tax=Trypanosoma congolense (strain IL3000) TaxID=1068625 RepID=F9W9D0_TRYCI|nr:unnamed protein product [Trypanosoma congolense IL3000]
MLHDSCINSSKLLQSSSLPVVGDNMYTAATLTKDEPLKRGKRRKFVRWSQRHKNFGSVSRKLNHGNNANHPRAGSGKSGARSAAPTQSPLEAPTTTIVAAGAAVTYAATPHVEKPAEKHLPRSTPVHERGKDRRREGAQFSPCRNEVGSKMSQSLSHSPVSHGIRIGIRNFVSGGIGSNCVTGQFTSPMTARCVSNRRHRVACNPVFQSSTLTAGVLATATKRYPCSLQNTRFKFMTSTSSPPVASAGGGGALPFNRK